MRPLLACMAVLALLLCPAGAFAQSAGDEQYADPFGEVEDREAGRDQGGGGGGNSGAGGESGATEQTPEAAAPTGEPLASVETGVATAEEAAGAQLPRTGLPLLLLAGAGALLATGGFALRRRL
jgi:LPXTG-motif cell wall-anchored protein